MQMAILPMQASKSIQEQRLYHTPEHLQFQAPRLSELPDYGLVLPTPQYPPPMAVALTLTGKQKITFLT